MSLRMRVFWAMSCIGLVLLGSAAPAEARERSKRKAAVAPEPAADEPAEADDEPDWSKAMRGKSSARKKARAPKPEPEPEPIAEEEPAPVAEEAEQEQEPSPSEADENNRAIDAADIDAAADDEAASEVPPAWWFGAYVRGVWVPSFMLSLFLEGPPTIGNASFGALATYRNKDGFSLVVGLGYTGYSFDGPFHQTGAPDQDTEWVKSSLGLVHLTGELLWSSQVHELLAIEYGIGVDFGVVTGELVRTEAWDTGSGYAPCNGPGSPNAFYCEAPQTFPTDAYDTEGAHYGVVEERVPPIALLPMLPLLALRFTPARELALKLELSYGIFQFAAGISAAYGVDL